MNLAPDCLDGMGRVDLRIHQHFGSKSPEESRAAAPGAPVAGQTDEMCYDVRAPEAINLTSEYNRVAYAQWTAISARGTAHAFVTLKLAAQARYDEGAAMPTSWVVRLVRALNILIAIALLVGAVLVYRYAWRPLAQTAGTVAAPVAARVTVARDALGVAHITAAGEDDALFAQGYVTAQDRLFQMDGLRRLAAGELAEVFGPALMETDAESRNLRLRRIAEAAYVALPARQRRQMAAYARGVNEFLSTHLSDLPVEFTLARYQPRPWSVVDSMLVALQMVRTLTTSWRSELAKRTMLEAGDRAKVEFLFPARTGGEVSPGSNAWVVAGAHTASGRPLLANDMHLEYTLPGIWYMTHLRAPDLDVAGVTVPGLPGVLVGHNRRIAWGITNLEFDVQDLYLEKIDDRTGRYLYRGQTEQARAEREVIRVKGAAPLEVLVWVTRHGPVVAVSGNQRFALRWVAAEPGMVSYPFLDIDRARDWREFTAALAEMPVPGSNFVYADVDGNIGYHAAGRLPVRQGCRGDVPADGSTGACEWQGYIPFDRLPAAFNPPRGIIVTANQNPFPENYPHEVNGNFAAPYRAGQIQARLAAREGWRAGEMLGVQMDVYSAFSHYLAGALVNAYEARRGHSPALEEAVALLRAWNGQMDRDQTAPLVVTLAYQQLRRAVAERAAPGKGGAWDFPLAPWVIEKLLRARPAGWFEDYDLTLLRSLVDGIEEGRRIQGRDVRKWKYGAYQRLTLNHPVLHRVPWVGKYFDVGTIPMSGSSTTVKQIAGRLGPSMRMSADLANWDASLLNIPIGQSGQPLSPHYKDQWESYYAGRSFPMQFERVTARSVLEFVPAR